MKRKLEKLSGGSSSNEDSIVKDESVSVDDLATESSVSKIQCRISSRNCSENEIGDHFKYLGDEKGIEEVETCTKVEIKTESWEEDPLNLQLSDHVTKNPTELAKNDVHIVEESSKVEQIGSPFPEVFIKCEIDNSPEQHDEYEKIDTLSFCQVQMKTESALKESDSNVGDNSVNSRPMWNSPDLDNNASCSSTEEIVSEPSTLKALLSQSSLKIMNSDIPPNDLGIHYLSYGSQYFNRLENNHEMIDGIKAFPYPEETQNQSDSSSENTDFIGSPNSFTAEDLPNEAEQSVNSLMDNVAYDNISLTERPTIAWEIVTKNTQFPTPEVFRAKVGVNVDHLTPFSILRSLLSDEILTFITEKANIYGCQIYQSKYGEKLFTDKKHKILSTFSQDELVTFIGMSIFMGLRPFSILKDYWDKSMWGSHEISKQMSRDRYLHIDKCLNYWNEVDEHNINHAEHLLNLFQTKFKTSYFPRRNLTFEESVIGEKVRHSVDMYTMVGVKLYALCEATTGYHLQFRIYTGNDVPKDCQLSEKLPLATPIEKIICTLLEPYANKGHTIYMSDCNIPVLALYLKSYAGTDTVGSFQPNNPFPPSFYKMTTHQADSKPFIGTSLTSRILIKNWFPANGKNVNVMSTKHNNNTAEVEIRSRTLHKPESVIDYHKNISKIDQMLETITVERDMNPKWPSKFLKRILNISLHNAYIIYLNKNDIKAIANVKFRKSIVEEIFSQKLASKVLDSPDNEGNCSKSSELLHQMQSIGKSRYCWYCPKFKGKQRKSVWICTQCNKQLCRKPCFSEFHSKLFKGELIHS